MPALRGVPLFSLIAVASTVAALVAIAVLMGYEIHSKARFWAGALAMMAAMLAWDAYSRTRIGPEASDATIPSADETTADETTDDLVRQLDAAVARAAIKKPHNAEPIELDALLARCVKTHGRTTLLPMRAPVHMIGARGEIATLFDILIGNALRNGARAIVRMDHGTTLAAIHVDDDGPGVARPQRERIFSARAMVEADVSDADAALRAYGEARRIARAHGGDVLVSSSPEGGARFTVHLPLHCVAAAEPALAPAALAETVSS